MHYVAEAYYEKYIFCGRHNLYLNHTRRACAATVSAYQPPHKVTSAEMAEGGSFSVMLPDFVHDPVVGSYKRPGEFIFTVSDTRAVNACSG